MKISDDISFAAIPVVYGTTHHALFHVARIQQGESVLIHEAAGGFGEDAVVLALYAGAKVFTTCSSESKRDILHHHYNVPLDHILSSREPSCAPAVVAMTNGRGVDMVLKFIEVGKVDLEALSRKRNKGNLSSTTLDLCVIRKVGYVENRIKGGDDTIANRFSKQGFGEVDVAVVLGILKTLCSMLQVDDPAKSELAFLDKMIMSVADCDTARTVPTEVHDLL